MCIDQFDLNTAALYLRLVLKVPTHPLAFSVAWHVDFLGMLGFHPRLFPAEASGVVGHLCMSESDYINKTKLVAEISEMYQVVSQLYPCPNCNH